MRLVGCLGSVVSGVRDTCADQFVNSHTTAQPLGNHGIGHDVRGDLLGRQLPPIGVQAARFDSVVFNSVVENWRSIAALNSKFVTHQHKTPSPEVFTRWMKVVAESQLRNENG